MPFQNFENILRSNEAFDSFLVRVYYFQFVKYEDHSSTIHLNASFPFILSFYNNLFEMRFLFYITRFLQSI